MKITKLDIYILRAPDTGRPYWVSNFIVPRANGRLTLKEEPGLGLTLSEAALKKFGTQIL